MSLKQNIGETDKWVRIILGIIILAIGYYLKSWTWIVVGAIILITSVTKWCLLYRIFGISTCKIEKTNEVKTENKNS